jgi:uncharacterized protein YndB with AHSA1/START domain
MRDETMRKLVVLSFISLDGVMQAPGGPEEDPTGGFKHEGWAFASDDWEAPAAENDLRVGGKFKTVMAAKDKSNGFDFTGTYTVVKENELIEYDMDDGRHVKVEFEDAPGGVKVIETFDPDNQYPLEMQRSGWQAILDNFKKYVEQN